MKKKVVLLDKKGQKERYFKKAKEIMEQKKKEEIALNDASLLKPNSTNVPTWNIFVRYFEKIGRQIYYKTI